METLLGLRVGERIEFQSKGDYPNVEALYVGFKEDTHYFYVKGRTFPYSSWILFESLDFPDLPVFNNLRHILCTSVPSDEYGDGLFDGPVYENIITIIRDKKK